MFRSKQGEDCVEKKVGDYYWMVKTDNEEVFVLSDKAYVVDGTLIFSTEGKPVLAFSKGNWNYFRAASCVDGGLVRSIEHWIPCK